MTIEVLVSGQPQKGAETAGELPDGNTEIYCIDPRHVADIWPLVSHYILRAHGRVDIGRFVWTEAEVLSRRALLWVTMRGGGIVGAGISQVQHTDRRKICVVLGYGADFLPDDWRKNFAAVEDYARKLGCHSIRITGRKGWARVMKDYRVAYTVLEKKL